MKEAKKNVQFLNSYFQGQHHVLYWNHAEYTQEELGAFGTIEMGCNCV